MPLGDRPLLPRSIGVASKSSLATPLWQRERIEAACQDCRKRKIKCNGERPACGACVDRGNPCAYVTNPEETRSQALKRKYSSLDEKLSVYNEFYDILRSRPLEEANDVLHRLRTGASVEGIVQHIKSADLLLQLSVQPPTRFRYSMGGILEIPGVLKTTDNPYIASLAYKIMPQQASQSAAAIGSGASDYLAMYDAPYHTVQMINADIDAALPSKWTAVSSDDQLLRNLLRSYFTFAYPFFAFSTRIIFFAICCLRGYSKIPRRFEFWDPASLYYRFISEARRLWELEADETSLTTIQAAMHLHLEYGLNGLDKIGWSFCVQAVATAQKISLFTTYLKPRNAHWRNVQAMTAWALFGWQGFRCYHFDRPTLVTTPPALPLPQELGAYGELWLKYPTASAPVSLRFSDMFRAIAEFCTIMNDIANDVFLLSGNKKPQTLAGAIMFRHKLQQWYNRLPNHLGPQNIIIPAHFHLHVHYWLVMVRLFEPLQVLEADEHGTFPSSSLPLEESPRKIVSHAKKCLQTLVRLYYSCHGSDGFDSFMVLEASLIGFAMVTDILTPCEDTAIQDAKESSAVLCAHILYSQARMIYLSDVVFRVMQQNLTTNTTRKLAQFVNVSDVDEKRVGLIARQVQSEWPINISPLANIDNDRKLGNLFHAIIELSITDDNSDKHISSKGSTPAP